ncbi:MAG: conjugal transfer protein TraF [Gammaproteobacteria bacterium]|jgi:hypothetical protein
MKHYKKILSALLVAVFSSSAEATSISVEARSLGMGNARVATADIATAPFANPGMLAFQRSREDFALVVGFGAFLMDQGGVVDKINDYQTAYDNFQSDPVGNISEGSRAIAIAQSLEGDVLAPNASVLLSTGFSGKKWAFAFSARADAIAAGTVTNISQTVAELSDPAKNILELEGVLTSELGVSLARNFQLFGQKIGIGVKPKYFKVDNIYLSESISTIDTGLGDLIDDSKNDLGDYASVDIGFVMGLSKHTQIGLLLTNLVSHKINYINLAGTPTSLSFDTQARLGIAYRSDFLTLGADLDLIENDALLTSENFQALKSQFVSVGGEFNIYDFMQLRLGAQKNIADGISEAAQENLYTAGIGFWFGFNVDVAIVSQSDSLGGFLQTGFRF